MAGTPLFDQLDDERAHRETLIQNAARLGFRPATAWEKDNLSPEDLFNAMFQGHHVGPVFVRRHREDDK